MVLILLIEDWKRKLSTPQPFRYYCVPCCAEKHETEPLSLSGPYTYLEAAAYHAFGKKHRACEVTIRKVASIGEVAAAISEHRMKGEPLPVRRCDFCTGPLDDDVQAAGAAGNRSDFVICARCADRVKCGDYTEGRTCACGCGLGAHEPAEPQQAEPAPCQECGCTGWKEAGS